jgi:NlpE N-terminal domain
MKHRKSYLINIFLAACVLLTNSCSGAGTANVLSSKTVLVGSTPGDSLMKSLLAINPESRIDFIRWDLTLNHAENDSKTFVLNIVFGEGQPNTNGFKGGGEKLSFEGTYVISKNIYELKNEKTSTKISLIKLNDNLFHLLTPDNKLMVGNGGWSYTLSRKDSPANSSTVFPSRITSLPDDIARQVIFEGRTPCLDFARQYNLQVGNDCHKLKWKLTLFRDSKTNKPTTYALQTTLNRPNITEGKWTIIKGIKTNSEAVIYRLDPDKPDESVSFLVGDENVLFFLDKRNQLFTGNGDFSFTLNRRRQ